MSHAESPRDTIATRLMGITLGILVMLTLVAIGHTMGWQPVVGGLLTGLSGAVMGASGTSVNGAYLAAILGWSGATNFVLGLAMFLGFNPQGLLFG